MPDAAHDQPHRGTRLLFESRHFVARELRSDEVPVLQALFDTNPDYFITVNGGPPAPDEAQREFEELPPPHLSYGEHWFAGVFDRARVLKGLVVLVTDLGAQGVWHTALFFVERGLRGSGAAMELHQSLEARALASGAQWLRLGVIAGNHRAERFWAKCGYTEVRTRDLVNAAGQAKTVKVLVKPLAGGTLAEYLETVPRDAPNSPLP